MLAVSINWLAVLVAALAYMGIGMLWYGPLFGKQWMALMGITKKSMKDMKLIPQQAMAGGALSALVMSYVLAHFVDYLEAITVPQALQAAFWIWLGFVATFQLGSFLWEGKDFKLFILNTANSLVALMVMAAILVAWQ